MDGIKAHCMGMEFPKFTAATTDEWLNWLNEMRQRGAILPSAADLDAVAEEQKAKEQTSGKTQS